MSKCVPATQNMFNLAHLEYHYYCRAVFKYVHFVAIVQTDKDTHTPRVPTGDGIKYANTGFTRFQ